MNEYEQLALIKIRDAYTAGVPILEGFMREHQRVQAVINLITSAIYLSDSPSDEGTKSLLENLNIVQKYITMTYGVVTSMHGTASMVHSILSEHEVHP